MVNYPDGLDEIGWRLLRALQENARVSYSELARVVGLSVPSVIERVRKLEEAGVITGYSVRIDVAKLGLPLTAVVRFQGDGYQMNEAAVAVQSMPEVVQAYRMTGDTCFVAVVRVESMAHLERFLDGLKRYGQTHTSIVVSTPVEQRLVGPDDVPHGGKAR